MPKPLRILFDASPLLVNKTGVAYYTERLVTQLANEYPDKVELVGFYYNFLGRRRTDHFPKARNLSYHEVRYIPSKVLYQLRRWGIEMPIELLARQKCDFVLYPNFLGYPSVHHTPSAPVVHDLTYLDLPSYVASKNQHDLERFVPQQVRRSAFAVTVSEFTKNRLVDAYGVNPDTVLVTPIPPEKPKDISAAETTSTLTQLGIDKPFILFLGTVEPRKNIVKLIDAYAKLPDPIRHGYKLVIAGRIGWNCEAEVAKLQYAKDHGYDVLHLGYVSEAQRAVLYKSTSLFVHTSHYEGFGMPVLEAMAYGAPCAISNIDIFHEVAGDSALYFNQEDPDSIAAGISNVLTDEKLRSKLGKSGQKHAEDDYSWENVSRLVYEKINQAVVA